MLLITTSRELLALERRVANLEAQNADLTRRLAAAEAWQAEADQAAKEFPAAFKRGLEKAFKDA